MRHHVHWAVVHHRHGVNVYLAPTAEALLRRLSEYAVEWSDDVEWDVPEEADENWRNPVERAHDNTDYAGAVETYFDGAADYEWVDTGMETVDFPLVDDPAGR